MCQLEEAKEKLLYYAGIQLAAWIPEKAELEGLRAAREKNISQLKPQSFEPAPQNMTMSIFKFCIF